MSDWHPTLLLKAQRPRTVVVVITAYDLPEYREAVYRSGASHFLAKGVVSQDEILRVVQHIVDTTGAP